MATEETHYLPGSKRQGMVNVESSLGMADPLRMLPMLLIALLEFLCKTLRMSKTLSMLLFVVF